MATRILDPLADGAPTDGPSRIHDELSRMASATWNDVFGFDYAVKELVLSAPLTDPSNLAAFCSYLTLSPVQELLRTVPADRLAPALDVAHADPQIDPLARLAARARLLELLRANPTLVDRLDSARRSQWQRTLADEGLTLPPFTGWTTPWGNKKKRKPIDVKPPPWPERVHAQRPPPVSESPRDAEIRQQLARPGPVFVGYLLLGASDALALQVWKELDVEGAFAWELGPLVVRMGLEGLETSLRLVSKTPSELPALLPVESPRVAPVMATALQGRPASKVTAREWFAAFPATGAVGLVPHALSADAPKAGLAQLALRFLQRTHADGFQSALSAFPEAVRAAVTDALSAPPSLPSRRPALPPFLTVEALPPLVTKNPAERIDAAGLRDVVAILAVTPLGGAPWIDELKMTFTADSCARLARALFDAWLGNGCPPKQKWLLQSLAHFGDDALAVELADRAAELAPKGLSARAQEMVEVLGALKTRTSLSLVHQLSRKVRSKAFKTRALLVFTSAAEEMGLTEDELAERLVPDFGLAPDGTLPTSPPVRLDVSGPKPRFIDEAGAVVKQLPAGRDEEQTADFAELKKRAPALVKEALARLELRMVTERRMSRDHFSELYLMHGLLGPVARLVVWGAWKGSTLERSFSVSDGSPRTLDGGTLMLEPDWTIGVVHPLHLTDDERAAWSKRVANGPFHQLQRRAERLASFDALVARLRRLEGLPVAAGRFLSLEANGWSRGPTQDGGCYFEVVRALPGLRTRVQFTPGIYIGDPTMHGDQHVEAVVAEATGVPSHVVMAEVARQLEEILRS